MYTTEAPVAAGLPVLLLAREALELVVPLDELVAFPPFRFRPVGACARRRRGGVSRPRGRARAPMGPAVSARPASGRTFKILYSMSQRHSESAEIHQLRSARSFIAR